MLSLDCSKVQKFVSAEEMDNMEKITSLAADILESGSGAGNDFLGWVDLPVNYDKEEFARIKKAADKIRSDSQVLVVVGIGGSYLGAKAATSMRATALPISVQRAATQQSSMPATVLAQLTLRTLPSSSRTRISA